MIIIEGGKKRKERHHNLPYIIEAVRENIYGEKKEKGMEIFRKKIKIIKIKVKET